MIDSTELYWVVARALEQSYDCPSQSVIRQNMVKISQYQSNKAQTLCIILVVWPTWNFWLDNLNIMLLIHQKCANISFPSYLISENVFKLFNSQWNLDKNYLTL